MKLGIEVIEDARFATHVISPRIARTKKFVVAIPHNPHFVNYNWFLETLKSRSLATESDFPPDAAIAAAWSKDLDFEQIQARAARERKKGGLLRDHKVLVSDAVCKVGGLETYKEIVEANGGQCNLALRKLRKSAEILKQDKAEGARIMRECLKDIGDFIVDHVHHHPNHPKLQKHLWKLTSLFWPSDVQPEQIIKIYEKLKR